MSKNKKTFKDQTSHLDRFFTIPEESGTHETHGTEDTQRTQKTHEPHRTHLPNKIQSKYYRFNLKLKIEHKEYLDRISWQNRKSITQYINDLIDADKATRNIQDI